MNDKLKNKIRVRFAPSPTGFLHVGGARTALFNYLFAKKNNGTFILRIEDTDIERSREESTVQLIDSLKWLGLEWDEGPGVGGGYGPYFQSKRHDIYRNHAKKLLDSGHAYYCFCTQEETRKRRQEKGEDTREGYDNFCRSLTAEQVSVKLEKLDSHVIRFRIPDVEEIVFKDIVHGEIKFSTRNFSDFVIIRSNGLPIYNFSCAVDDHLMNISHVIRGDDHIANTPKQKMIMEALKFPLPEYAHVSMIMGADGKRLSKRHGATSVEEFIQQGYLDEALINFTSLLGWYPKHKGDSIDEIMTIEQLVNEFDLAGLSSNPAIFDMEKLNWMNSVYINKLEPLAILKRLKEIREPVFDNIKTEMCLKIIEVLKTYIKTLGEYGELACKYFPYSFDMEINRTLTERFNTKDIKEICNYFIENIENADLEEKNTIKDFIVQAQRNLKIKGKDFYKPLRYILTGKESGPEIDMVFWVYGKDLLKQIFRKLLH